MAAALTFDPTHRLTATVRGAAREFDVMAVRTADGILLYTADEAASGSGAPPSWALDAPVMPRDMVVAPDPDGLVVRCRKRPVAACALRRLGDVVEYERLATGALVPHSLPQPGDERSFADDYEGFSDPLGELVRVSEEAGGYEELAATNDAPTLVLKAPFVASIEVDATLTSDEVIAAVREGEAALQATAAAIVEHLGFREAAELVLREAKCAMTVKQIAAEIERRGLVQHRSKKPEQTLSTVLIGAEVGRGGVETVVRTAPATYGLAAWNMTACAPHRRVRLLPVFTLSLVDARALAAGGDLGLAVLVRIKEWCDSVTA